MYLHSIVFLQQETLKLAELLSFSFRRTSRGRQLKKNRKTNIGVNVPKVWSNRFVNFQFARSKVRRLPGHTQLPFRSVFLVRKFRMLLFTTFGPECDGIETGAMLRRSHACAHILS